MRHIRLNFFVIISFLFIIFSSTVMRSNRKYVIGPWPGGFGAHLYALLCHIRFCEFYGMTPVVYWGRQSLYYSPQGFNGVQHNAWEYYFYPISDLQYTNGDPIHVFLVDYKDYYFSNYSQEVRDAAYVLIKKYIKLKPMVQAKIDQFVEINMAGKKTIGIHLRGTDKYTEVPLMSPERMVAEALKYDKDGIQYLIASDELRLFNKMKYLLEQQGRKVIYYDCYRSENGQPLHVHKIKPSYAQLGEDVLVEMLLLSKCDLLIHSHSNVSGNAIYFNPKLEHVLIQ